MLIRHLIYDERPLVTYRIECFGPCWGSHQGTENRSDFRYVAAFSKTLTSNNFINARP